MRWLSNLLKRIRELREPPGRAEGWCILVEQHPAETVEQAVARSAREQGFAPESVMGALVLGFPDTDRVRNWPRWFEWRRPGFQGQLRHLCGYRRVQIEQAGILTGPH